MSAAGSSAIRARRRRASRSALLLQRVVPIAAILGTTGLVVGLVFAGSPARIASGVRVDGVDVGGLTAGEARRRLEARAARLAHVPVVFTADGHSWRVEPAELGVKVDWRAAVAAAQREGTGFGPFRGLRRLEVRVFGADVVPQTQVWNAALALELRRFARAVQKPHREAAVVLHGLDPAVVPGTVGRSLDRAAAAALVVRALAGLTRQPVALPVRVVRPRVSAADLRAVVAQVRTAVSAPVRLQLGPTRWRIPRWRLAGLLALPHGGRTGLRIAGRVADHFFGRLEQRIDHPSRDAAFAVWGDRVHVVPAKPGTSLDVPTTARRLLTAALSPTARVARAAVEASAPKLSTAEAEAMHITRRVASYETIFGGDPNRIHNVQLVAQLIDGHLIAPGATFSFNRATGARTAERGFRVAPVIINGELQTGLGGGVCQVSTTVFNAAYEAGLAITARTNHALYISHYPQGRDATVDYPSVDLRFVNDTPHWLLLRTFVGSSSLVVGLYGTPTGRRVVSETAPLVDTGPPPVQRVEDPSLPVGKTVLEDSGEPSRATSVHRRVYNPAGRLLHDDVWSSSYRAEPRIVRVGTKPKPKAKQKPKEPATGPTGATTTPGLTTTTTQTRGPTRP